MLDRYARLLVQHSVALQRHQELFIMGRLAHRDLALRIGEAAYAAGARHVQYRLDDPLEWAQLIELGNREQIERFYQIERAWLLRIGRARGAGIVLASYDKPDLWKGLAQSRPEAFADFHRAKAANRLMLSRQIYDQKRIAVVFAAAPSMGWAERLFPELEPEEALSQLMEKLSRLVGTPEQASSWSRDQEARRGTLDALSIREVLITGAGNNLRVGFPSAMRWQGDTLRTTAGQPFRPNVPMREIFTCPHRERAGGRLVAAHPLRCADGLLVRGLVLEFQKGRVVGFEADEGAEGFGRWIDTDDGARHLGEFALAEIPPDSMFFDQIYVDENAGSHVALGSSFPFTYTGNEQTTARALQGLGWNHSAIHTDIIFGSPGVDVVATESARRRVVPLIKGGRWAF